MRWRLVVGIYSGLVTAGLAGPAAAQVANQAPSEPAVEAAQATAPVAENQLPEVVVEAGSIAEPANNTKKKSKPAAAPGPAPVQDDVEAAAGNTNGADQMSGGAVGIEPSPLAHGRGSSRVVEQVTTVEEISAAEIQRTGAKTLDEAIDLLPGMYVRNGADGTPRIDIRGLRTRNVTLLIDGVPQNSTFDGQFDPRRIPVENIARIKITRGGSSVLYGPGGNAAVIDIVTKGAAPGLHGSGETSAGIDRSEDVRATASYGSATTSTFVSASVYNQDSFKMPDSFVPTAQQPGSERVNSDREDRALYANSSWSPNEDFR